MHVELLDYRCHSAFGDTGSDVEAMACAATDLPIIAVTPDFGLRALASLGVHPTVRVSPVAGSARLTVRSLRRALRAFGATAVRCRSPFASRLADLTGLPLSIDMVPPEVGDSIPHLGREAIRARFGLAPTDRLCVPLAARGERIDAILLAMGAGALSIAEIPVVMVQPSIACHAQRSRRLLSSSDRPLAVIATHAPMLSLAPGADILIWGPHADRSRFDPYGLAIERWTRQFNAPFLCSNTLIEAAMTHGNISSDQANRLVPCNGISGAEIASSILTALGDRPAD